MIFLNAHFDVVGVRDSRGRRSTPFRLSEKK
jgi:acetylornithine deacetylase/succinyl-diaminopimelate desuccinylase-like protein